MEQYVLTMIGRVKVEIARQEACVFLIGFSWVEHRVYIIGGHYQRSHVQGRYRGKGNFWIPTLTLINTADYMVIIHVDIRHSFLLTQFLPYNAIQSEGSPGHHIIAQNSR
jgi:hypothetical protein